MSRGTACRVSQRQVQKDAAGGDRGDSIRIEREWLLHADYRAWRLANDGVGMFQHPADRSLDRIPPNHQQVRIDSSGRLAYRLDGLPSSIRISAVVTPASNLMPSIFSRASASPAPPTSPNRRTRCVSGLMEGWRE